MHLFWRNGWFKMLQSDLLRAFWPTKYRICAGTQQIIKIYINEQIW